MRLTPSGGGPSGSGSLRNPFAAGATGFTGSALTAGAGGGVGLFGTTLDTALSRMTGVEGTDVSFVATPFGVVVTGEGCAFGVSVTRMVFTGRRRDHMLHHHGARRFCSLGSFS